MHWQNQLNGDSIGWLMEQDNPGTRYLAMREIMDLPADDPELITAQELVH